METEQLSESNIIYDDQDENTRIYYKKPMSNSQIGWLVAGIIILILIVVMIILVSIYLTTDNNKLNGAKNKVAEIFHNLKRVTGINNNTTPGVKLADWTTGIISPIGFDEKQRRELLEKYQNDKECFNSTIMISISSYRDPELCLTLRDMIEKSINPSRLYFCIFEQNDPTDEDICHAKTILKTNLPIKPEQFRIETIHFSEAKGPTYARAMCEKLWRGEKYYLMVDSHMRVEPGWDAELIKQLQLTHRPYKTVLTMYPEGYEREYKGDALTYKIGVTRGWRRERFKKFNEHGIIEFESITTFEPIPAHPKYVPFWGACFHFSHSDVLKEVPYHPDTPFLFFGEEIFMGARFYTNGWDLKSPTFSIVYHLWRRDHRKTFWTHENVVQREYSVKKVKDILTEKIKDPQFGLGTRRTITDFWNFAGVDFEGKKVTRPSDPWTLPAGFQSTRDEFCIYPNNESIPMA